MKKLDNITNFEADILANSEISLLHSLLHLAVLLFDLSIQKTLPGPIPLGLEALEASSCVPFSLQQGSIINSSSSVFSFTLFVSSTPILTIFLYDHDYVSLSTDCLLFQEHLETPCVIW